MAMNWISQHLRVSTTTVPLTLEAENQSVKRHGQAL